MNAETDFGKKIFVTGSFGFIGSHIIRKLTESHITNSSCSIDLLNRKELLELDPADAVIHAAGRTPYRNNKSLVDYYDNNVVATLNVLEYCIKKKIKKLIYLSTYVYGLPQQCPINEEHPITPHTPYTESKYLAERLCKSYCDNYDLKVIVLRPFSIFGESAPKGSLIANLIRSIKTEKKIQIINKDSKRDFLFIDDFVDLVITMLDYDSKFDIFNVGSGKSYSFEEILRLIEKMTNKRFEVEYIENKSEIINEIRADISKITSSTNWKPKINLEKGLRILLKPHQVDS